MKTRRELLRYCIATASSLAATKLALNERWISIWQYLRSAGVENGKIQLSQFDKAIEKNRVKKGSERTSTDSEFHPIIGDRVVTGDLM